MMTPVQAMAVNFSPPPSTVVLSSASHSESDDGLSVFADVPDEAGMGQDDCPAEFADSANDDCQSIGTEYWEESDSEIAEDLEPALLLPESDDELSVEQHALIRWIVFFVSLFRTLHVIPQRAVGWLLCFFGALLKYLGRYSEFVREVAVAFPCSVYLMKQYMDQYDTVNTFQKYVVCPKCHSLYNFEENFQKQGHIYVIKTCQHAPSGQGRPICGMPLLKRVVSRRGKPQVYPHLVYVYNPVKPTLSKLFSRHGFHALCESTRPTGLSGSVRDMSDVFDGRMWKEFQDSDGTVFMSNRNNYGFFLNVDWYQPYKHKKYSIGVIYMVLLNLPREVRYKRENVILVGLIPGPKEPPLTVNSYITPLVSELLELWNGVQMPISEGRSYLIRCAVVCVGCDLPAGRKLCGFLSYSANFGCSRCYASFSCGFGCRDYSGFDRTKWKERTNSKHRKDVAETLQCTTKTARKAKESEVGCRYSALLQLPYFDPVKMLIIDPMHNLFLGTAKYIVHEVWIAEGYLDRTQLSVIEDRIASMGIPSTVHFGRLPSSIESTTTLTAEQWMNWVNYFSVFCLYGLLPPAHLECWRHFVLASRLLCKPSISQTDVTVADLLLVQFCKRFQTLYGPQLVTPNMHMHCHLGQCARDYGPLCSFWLYPFERYNGMMEGTPTNNRSIEIQVMQRFVSDIRNLSLLNSVEKDESSLFSDVVITHAESFQSTSSYCKAVQRSSKQVPLVTSNGLQVTPGPKYTISTFTTSEFIVIKDLYLQLYPQYYTECEDLELPLSFQKMKSVTVEGRNLESNVYYLADSVLPFDVPLRQPAAGVTLSHSQTSRPVKVLYYAVHRFLPPGSSSPVVTAVARVFWPQSHPERFSMGKPVEVWCFDLFEASAKNGFIPVDKVSAQLLTSETKLNDERVLVTIPVIS